MYRTPMVVGDRVALAPHTDLWMTGNRYGACRDIIINEEGFLRYLVQTDAGPCYWLAHDDLMGAVAGTPVGGEREQSATGSIQCSWCDEPATRNLDTTRDQCCETHFTRWFV